MLCSGGDRRASPSVEETAWALETLSESALVAPSPDLSASLRRAAASLVQQTDEGGCFPASPLGLHFAKLWYTKRLLSGRFTAGALTRLQEASVTLHSETGY